MSTIYRHGNTLVVPIPHQLLTSLQLAEGAEVAVVLDSARGQIVIVPIDQPTGMCQVLIDHWCPATV